MKNLTFVFAIIFSFQTSSFAIESSIHYDSIYVLGNQSYQNKNYEEALATYLNILESGLESPNLYYNIGNTYYKLNAVPEAILYYEKALKLKPGEPDYQYNLQLANKLIVDKIESLPVPFYKNWRDSFINSFSTDSWAYLSIGFLILSLVGLFAFLLSNSVILKKLSFYLFIVFSIASGSAYLFANTQFNQNFKTKYAVVFSTRISIYSEPNTTSTVLFVIHQGLKVQVLNSENKWLKILLPDGSIGWIPEEGVQFI